MVLLLSIVCLQAVFIIVLLWGLWRFSHDSLTGLWIRRVYEVLYRLTWKTRRCLPVHVIFIDVDDFKSFNTRFGHRGGDTVLTMIGSVIKRASPGLRIWPARFGGDEFCVILIGYEYRQANRIGIDIWQGVRQLRVFLANENGTLDAPRITVTVSVATREQFARSNRLQSKDNGKDRVIPILQDDEDTAQVL